MPRPLAPSMVFLAFVLLTAAPGIMSLHAQAYRERFPFALTSGVVASALGRTGLAVEASQIDLPPQLNAATREPQVRIAAATSLADGRLRLRLLCQPARDCMPFMVTLRLASPAQRETASAGWQVSEASTPSPTDPASVQRIAAGQHITLRMGDDRMAIALDVVAIDTGTAGSEIRVSSLDRKQLFRAVVVDAANVRGRLP